MTQEIATIKVQLDGDTFDFELPAEIVTIDTGDASAVAERNNVVRQELTSFKPETAEGDQKDQNEGPARRSDGRS